MTLEWIDPPVSRADEARELASTLRARPNEWARFAQNVSSDEHINWLLHLGGGEKIEVRAVRVDTGWRGQFFESAMRYDMYARARMEAE